jgi:hypothetical protein
MHAPACAWYWRSARNNIYDSYCFHETLTCACMQVLAQRNGRAWYARRRSVVIHVRGVLHHIAQWHATRSMESAAQSPSIRNKLSMSCIHTPSRAKPNDAKCSPSCTCPPPLPARTQAHAILHTHKHTHTHTHTHKLECMHNQTLTQKTRGTEDTQVCKEASAVRRLLCMDAQD